MAKRFTKPTTNWLELSKKVPPDQQAQYVIFRTKSQDYLRRMLANPPEPPPIDWEAYRKDVPVPGLVDEFKKKYEAFKVPYPADTMTAKVDEQWKVLEPQIKKFCAEQQKYIDEAKKEIARIKSLLPFSAMTMEDFCVMYPKDALDFVKKPSFWPHEPDDQADPKALEPRVVKEDTDEPPKPDPKEDPKK